MDEELMVAQPADVRLQMDQALGVDCKPALLDQASAQIENIMGYIVDALLDQRLGADLQQNAAVAVDPGVLPEDVFVDLMQRKVLLEDVAGLMRQAERIDESGAAVIQEVMRTDQFFNETFLKEATDQLARDALGIGVDQRQALENQEQVFAAEREKLVGGLIATLAPGEEKTIEDVGARLDALEERLAACPEREAQAATEQERAESHRQTLATEAEYEQYRTIEWLAKTVDYNQQCLDALNLLQTMRPELPVVLGTDGAPMQLTQSNCVGEAYATEAAVREAADAEYQRRLAEEVAESQRKEPHVLHVEVRDREQQTIAEWWEMSEHDQLEKEGHTEQKMATRIDFDVMRDQGYSLHLEGVHAPCEYDRGCELMLNYYAEEYKVPIEYFDQRGVHRYPKE